MGREIKRVPLSFRFPINKSYADHCYYQHLVNCPSEEAHYKEECEQYSYEPPKGEGWQLWQTVSDGPITPVFATADELIEYMCAPPRTDRGKYGDERDGGYSPQGQGWERAKAEKFVRGEMSSPSFVMEGGKIVDGVDFVTEASER